MGLIEVKTAKITKKGQIAIPKDIRDIEGFRQGQKIAILAFDDRVELRPLKSIKSGRIAALLSEKALAKEWSTKEEDDAWKNL